MGHKKRNVAASRSSKLSSPSVVLPTTTSAASDTLLTSLDNDQTLTTSNPKNETTPFTELDASTSSLSYSAIKVECERALTSLRRGNYTKAIRLMKDLTLKHETSSYSALIHRVQGTVCVKVASIIDDPASKHRHLKNAIESARKAVSLSPNSIEFAHFYANLLYEAANEGKEYEEVVHECEKALAIENPVDPGKENLQEESQQKISTPEARISHVQAELRGLIQKSNIASISTWMKNFGNGEEKFRLIPIRRAAEDPMELRLVQARRPNEIKKATKTPEEKRKEIEVRVAAARLLQHKSDSLNHGDDGDNQGGLDSPLGSGQKVGERRKSGNNVRKNESSGERRDWVRSFWNSMSLDMKRELLKVGVLDLKSHFSSSKDGLPNEVLTEALSFAGANNKSWKFWLCCRCNEKFVDSQSHIQHVAQDHLGNLMPKMKSVLPQNLENEWVDMILKCSWKPLDVYAAVEMLKNQSKSQATPEFLDVCNSRKDAEECKETFANSYCSEGALDSSLSPRKYNSGDSCNGFTEESRDCDKMSDTVLRECDGNQGCKSHFIPDDNWPLSEDAERAKLLERIRIIFEALIGHKYLATSHLSKVIQFAGEELQSISSGSQLLSYGVDQTPLCICFLGAPELKKILKFLQELSHSCGIGRYPDKGNALEDSKSAIKVANNMEKIILNEDASCLLLDEHFLRSSITHTTDDADTVISDDGFVLDDDALLSWIFTGPTSGEQLASWTHTREDKAHQGIEILQMLEKEFYHLQTLCDRKCEHLSYEEALQGVEDLCLEEGKKREHVTEFVRHRSYESLLRKRREELVESDNVVMLMSNRFELDAISNVLKEAESLNANQFGFEESFSGGTSHLCDLESGEEDDWRRKDYIHQVDSCVEVAIQRLKEQVSVELSKIDARIMRSVTGMQQLEAKLDYTSAHDYRSIIIPLVKSYMRAQLEDLAEKDATEKSDAAREAFLAELALDSKKGGGGGGSDSSRHLHEKMKDKKKNKEYRKTKDSKPAGHNELHMLHHEATEQNSPSVAYDGELSDGGIAVARSDDALNQQEEEFRRRMELEAEERKLEETLEYQRRIENEAKQKRLAEQYMKTAKTIPEKMVAVGLPDANMKHSDDEQDVHDQLKLCEQEPLILKNESPNILEGVPISTGDGTAQTVDMNHSHHLTKGLSNGEILEDGVLSSDRRTGRRRRSKNTAKLVGEKYQPLSSEKENIEVGHVKPMDSLHGESNNPYLGDNRTKTLRQLQAEEDDEEKFQADLKKAVQQSLDAYHANQKLPSASISRMPPMMNSEVGDLVFSSKQVVADSVNQPDIYGTGLTNEIGEYNCFLNVIIQSLWHLKRFRDEFLKRSTSEHVHVGDPCVVCALSEIFTALNTSFTDTRREPIAPTSLRIALSNLYPDSNFFQEAQMNDASEVLGVIFYCLHQSFTSCLGVSDTESLESNCMGSWDCVNNACMAHSLFGMDIFERMNCYNCGLESRHLKYTSFFHNVNASALRTMKVMCPESSFDELLNLVEMNHQLACDPEAGGCGKLNHIHHILSTAPHVFTTVLGWQNTCESAEDIAATLKTLATEIDIGALYRGLDPKNKHCLVSVVCYYGQHYHCFAYSNDHEMWVMYDDKTVKVIGGWNDVISMCERGHLQPQVLLFEAFD